MAGPLTGIRVIELEGRGPGPFAGMMLADLGADVVRIGRIEQVDSQPGRLATTAERLRSNTKDPLARGRRSVAIDLKHPEGLRSMLRLLDEANVLIENLRPGAAEKAGFGPEVCLERNPGLVYARSTGWGQNGPNALSPGHDINFVALTGLLDLLRPRVGESPHPPFNLLGNFGGGGMLLVVGILSALVERSLSGKGQVIDVSMLDGVALMTALFHGLRAAGLWSDTPGTNLLDLGAPFYNVYETSDGRYVALASTERADYEELLKQLDLLGDDLFASWQDPSTWPEAKQRLAAIFNTRTRDEWSSLLENAGVCLTPVLTLDEAPAHPHNAARRTFIEIDGVVQPAPAPRYSRTPASQPGAPSATGQHTTAVLLEWGLSRDEVDALCDAALCAKRLERHISTAMIRRRGLRAAPCSATTSSEGEVAVGVTDN